MVYSSLARSGQYRLMAIALLAKLRSLHTAAIQYPYIVITLPRIIAISSHTYISRIIRLEPALTYLSGKEAINHDSFIINLDYIITGTIFHNVYLT